MKTQLLMGIFLAYVCNVYAQTATPYYTGFDNITQQAGWQKYRKGLLSTNDWAFIPFGGTPSSPNCASHNYQGPSNAFLVEDWLVSPMFNFSGGAIVDSIKLSLYTGSGIVTTNDHFGVYLLNGSSDPASATVTLLADLTVMASFSANFKDTFGFVIPPVGGNCYIGFKYTVLNNTFIARFDNLKISAGTPCSPPVNVVITPSIASVNVNWTAQSGAIGYKYVLDNNPGDPTITGSSTSNTSFTTQGLTPSTSYYFHLRTMCGSTITSGWKNMPFTTTAIPACTQPTSVYTDNITDRSVKLNWSTVTGSKGYEYIVSEDPGIPLSVGNTSLVNYANVDNLKANAKYYAYLRTRCDGTTGYIFSPWVGREFNTHIPVSVSTIEGNVALQVYPNPVKDLLSIKGTSLGANIVIANLTGSITQSFTTTNQVTNVDVGHLPAGMYTLRYSFKSSIYISRFIKE